MLPSLTRSVSMLAITAAAAALGGCGMRYAAPGRLEQLVTQAFLQFPDLRADGLYGHVQPFGRARKAAFLGDHPEVIQVVVIQGVHAAQINRRIR